MFSPSKLAQKQQTTVLPFIPEALFRNAVRKVVAVTISSVTAGTFLGRTSN